MKKSLILFAILLLALFVAVITERTESDSYKDEMVFTQNTNALENELVTNK